MPVIWNAAGMYRRVEYENEADLESAINQVQKQLFGPNRFYLDVKKKIGTKGAIHRNEETVGGKEGGCRC